MVHRVLPLCAASALIWFLSTSALAADVHRHTGTVVESGGGKLTMTDKNGQNQHTHDIGADTTILCGRKKCALEDIKPGSTVTVTMEKKGDTNQVTRVRARKATKRATS